MKHIIFYSTGLSSFFATHLLIQKYGKENVIAVFADTMFEDEDNYRFLKESIEIFDVKLITLCVGKNPYDVVKKKKYFGGAGVAPCSGELKVKPSKTYVLENYQPHECKLYFGIEWSEQERIEKIRNNWFPYEVDSPLLWDNYYTRPDFLNLCETLHISPPRMYALGFSHANCGGCCLKSGKKNWIKGLKFSPEKYEIAMATEEYLNNDRKSKGKKPYTIIRNISLKNLKEKQELQQQSDNDVVFCSCFD